MPLSNPQHDDPVLLIVDPQVGFINEERDEAAIKAIEREISTGRYAAVGATQLRTPEGSPFPELGGWSADEEDQEIHPRIAELGLDPVIEKVGYAPTRDQLREFADGRPVHLVGWETDACVYATAFAAFDACIDFYVLSGGCSTAAGPMAHQAALSLIQRQMPGRVLSH